MNASRNLWTAISLGLVGALVGVGLLMVFVFPTGFWNDASVGNRAAEQAEPNQSKPDQSTVGEGKVSGATDTESVSRPSEEKPDQAREVGKERAGEIAVDHLGGGQVTWSGKEDDHGALWEIEVTGPEGTETDVLVDAKGDVVHTVRKGQGDEAGTRTGGQSGSGNQPEPQPAQAPVDAQRAAEIAASHVGGIADTVHRETDGDYGAAWDVDVYAPQGEYTIYVSEVGKIVRVEGPFRD